MQIIFNFLKMIFIFNKRVNFFKFVKKKNILKNLNQ